MMEPILTFTPEEDDFDQDYMVQSALNDAIDAAINADDQASRPIYVKVSGDWRVFVVEKVTVDRDDEDDPCEITIHVKALE